MLNKISIYIGFAHAIAEQQQQQQQNEKNCSHSMLQ